MNTNLPKELETYKEEGWGVRLIGMYKNNEVYVITPDMLAEEGDTELYTGNPILFIYDGKVCKRVDYRDSHKVVAEVIEYRKKLRERQ
ncbi:MAG: hypothetical protein MJZ15_11200 [Bacteroidales bacterium]|nr:hypothetical protein [Bacteroidales bacterium]